MNAMLAAGLVAGVLDIVNAIAFWRLYAGTSATTILQSVAAGLLGKAAFSGGVATAALGLVLHLLILCAMAVAYWLAARRWPSLLAKPLAAGLAYGLLTWAAMNYVIVPLSRASAPPFILPWFVDGLLAHLLLVGIPFAFVARWTSSRVS
jgi:uncharacterized membrane protein YagU involved in acid resistance